MAFCSFILHQVGKKPDFSAQLKSPDRSYRAILSEETYHDTIIKKKSHDTRRTARKQESRQIPDWTEDFGKSEMGRGKMIYITGDTHGNQDKWMEQIDPVLNPGDTIIIAGDFGVGFWNGKYGSEDTFFDWIERQPYTVLFCDGNHCNFDRLYAFPVTGWSGGKVHVLRKNVLHLMRGEIYQIQGQSFFVMGGGYSLDRYRRVEGISWWSEEMPCDEEYKNARNRLAEAENRVDYIVTHTAPSETVFYMSTQRRFGIKANVEQEWELTTFLDYIQAAVQYKRWYFGHFHLDLELWRNQIALFSTIREAESGKIIRRWETYEG